MNFLSSNWWRAAGAIALTVFAGCGAPTDVDPAPPNDEAAALSRGESVQAREFVSRLREEFVVKPDVADRLPPGVEIETQPLLPEVDVESFDRDGSVLVPRLRATAEAPTAKVRIGARASDGFRVERLDSNFTLDVHLEGAREAAAEVGHGHVVFRGGLGDGVDVLHRAGPHGLEDFVRFDARPEQESLTYDVALSDGVRGLRLVANTLELLDASGTPRMRVAPPSVVDAAGAWHWASLQLEGCAADTSPLPPWGRPVTAPGAAHCTMRVDWTGAGVTYPALVDPNFWTNTGAMTTARIYHQAVLLSGGGVLAAGGLNGSGATVTSAEIWSPTAGTWAATGSMTYPRLLFGMMGNATSATTVVAAGGESTSATTCSHPCNKSEVYTVSSGTWGSVATMSAARDGFTFTSLGGTVLATAGAGASNVALATSDLYTFSTNVWAASGSLTEARYYHTATQLASTGTIDVIGGYDGTNVTTDIEEWSAGSWSVVGQSRPVYAQTAAWTTGGHVMTAGGIDSSGACVDAAYDWSAGGGFVVLTSMNHVRCHHNSNKLNDGTILVEGGIDAPAGTILSTAEIYDPSGNTWTSVASMGTTRYWHSSTLYTLSGTDKVLIAGGGNGSGPLSACEFFTH